MAVIETEQVVPDEDLSVDVRSRSDPDRRDREELRDLRRDGGRDCLEDDGEAARCLERECVGDKLCRLRRGATLGLEAPECRCRLRRQADVAHHRYSGTDDCVNPREHRPGTLDLHRIGARILDEADRVRHRKLVRDLKRTERHIGDDQGPLRAARDRAREHQHLLHRRRDCRVVSEDGHRRGVTDQDDVGPCSVGKPTGRGVVGGDHRDRRVTRFHAGEIRDRQLAGRGGAVAGCARAGTHESSSTGTLSMRRVVPTRTAAARTGGSNGAIST